MFVFQIYLDTDKDYDILAVSCPITIGTVPFRIPNSNNTPAVKYGMFVLIAKSIIY